MRHVAGADRGPVINTVEDHESGSRNRSVTPGQIVSLRGQRLKFDLKNTLESLVFQDSTNLSQKVPIPKPVIVSSKELYFIMPLVPFYEGVFALTSTLGTTRLRTGMSQPVQVATAPPDTVPAVASVRSTR